VKLPIYALVIVTILLNASYAYSESESSWENLLQGIGRYSVGEKLKEKFIQLCQENKTAFINGRVDTGGGLYMAGDVTAYQKPGEYKITQLTDKTLVVLTGETAIADEKEWVNIKFLYISAHTKTAVDIEEGWVEKGQLRDRP
jgi:hypothetical protein